MKHAQLAGGVLAGLFTGVVLGVLFAPAKGSETRKRIFERKNKQHRFLPRGERYVISGYGQSSFVDDSF